MKSYVYTRTERQSPARSGGHMNYTIKLYRVIRGTPKLVGTDTDQFCSDWQQCSDLLKKLKLWPRAADATDENGRKLYYYASQLRDAGILNVTQL